MNIEAEQSSAALHIVSRYRDHVGSLFAILSYAINTKYSNMPKHSPVFSSRLIFFLNAIRGARRKMKGEEKNFLGFRLTLSLNTRNSQI